LPESENRESANAVRRVSALLGAGLPANQAMQICSDDISKLSEPDKKQFDLVWGLSAKLGGPVLVTLNRIAEVFDGQQRNRREVKLAFSGPQATAKLVMWLPVLALVLGQAVGMNPIGAIFQSPLGALSVSLGLGLMVAGRQWTRHLLAKALPPEHDPGAYLDCVLIGLQAGLPLSVAQAEATQEYQVAFEHPPEPRNFERLENAAELSRSTGAAISQILIAEADAFREQHEYLVATRISKLGVQLMIPLGVAVLPAFILLSIVPIAISLLSNGQL
jgi:tight adherence protein B